MNQKIIRSSEKSLGVAPVKRASHWCKR